MFQASKKCKKIYDATSSQELVEIHRLLKVSDEDDKYLRDEDFGDESDINLENGVEECEEGSDTEQEGSDEDDIEENSNFFKSPSDIRLPTKKD